MGVSILMTTTSRKASSNHVMSSLHSLL